MSITLRENQVEPVRIGIEFLNTKKKTRPSILVLPTAFGKSICIAKIAEKVDGKVLVLQPSKELLAQNYEKYTMNGGTASVYSASFGKKEISDVTFATLGSIKKMGAEFKELGFTKLIMDECDRFSREADGMLRVFVTEAAIPNVLGLTATPFKLERGSFQMQAFSYAKMLTSHSKKRGDFFKDILYVAQIQEVTRLKYWSPIVYDIVEVDNKYLKYNTIGSEYTLESINIMYDEETIKWKILGKINDNEDRKSILIFVSDIEKAEELQSIIPKSEVLHSKLKKKERDRIVSGFKSMDIRIVINVTILSVGFDHPQLDCIVMARPTASISLYYQIIGRITRIHPDKKYGVVVDFSNNVRKFGRVEGFQFHKIKRSWHLFNEDDTQLTNVDVKMLEASKSNIINSNAEMVIN